jgi:hypothetical protein
MDDQHIAAYLRAESSFGSAVNTDDNAYLEYATPHEFLNRTQSIVAALKPYAGWERSRVSGAGADELKRIDELWTRRLSILDSELDKSVE